MLPVSLYRAAVRSKNGQDTKDMMAEQQSSLNGDTFQRFRALVYRESGIHLADHKRVMVASRLQKRLSELGLTSFDDYYTLVVGGSNDAELRVMLDCISTNQTDFFREPRHFTFLRDHVLPELAESKAVRIWSAACSSGEEPYSIAMTVVDTVGVLATRHCRILASDISTRMVATAAAGVYPSARVRSLSQDLLRRHFLRGKDAQADLVKVKPHLAEMIVFRRINLMEDRYPIKGLLDVIFCRNVMIYFDRATQGRVLARLSQCLKLGGYLFLGHAESMPEITPEFQYVAPTIYRKQ